MEEKKELTPQEQQLYEEDVSKVWWLSDKKNLGVYTLVRVKCISDFDMKLDSEGEEVRKKTYRHILMFAKEEVGAGGYIYKKQKIVDVWKYPLTAQFCLNIMNRTDHEKYSWLFESSQFSSLKMKVDEVVGNSF